MEKEYRNGLDFWRDLCATYGRDDAAKMARDYLDMQIYNTDADEHFFCCELYFAMIGNA